MRNAWVEKMANAVELANSIYELYGPDIEKDGLEGNDYGASWLAEQRDKKLAEEGLLYAEDGKYSNGELDAIWRGVGEMRGWGQERRWGYVL